MMEQSFHTDPKYRTFSEMLTREQIEVEELREKDPII